MGGWIRFPWAPAPGHHRCRGGRSGQSAGQQSAGHSDKRDPGQQRAVRLFATQGGACLPSPKLATPRASQPRPPEALTPRCCRLLFSRLLSVSSVLLVALSLAWLRSNSRWAACASACCAASFFCSSSYRCCGDWPVRLQAGRGRGREGRGRRDARGQGHALQAWAGRFDLAGTAQAGESQ